MNELALRNRQRVRRLNVAMFRRIVCTLLEEMPGVKNYELGIHLVAAPEMSRINKTFLHHEGSTDVITFDYTERSSDLRGEMFVLPGRRCSPGQAIRNDLAIGSRSLCDSWLFASARLRRFAPARPPQNETRGRPDVEESRPPLSLEQTGCPT